MPQTMVEKPIGSPSEDTQQSSQFGSPNEVQENTNVKLEATLFSTPKITMNVFGMLDWLTKKGWPQILKQQLGVVEEVNNNNVINEPLESELLFSQSLECISTRIPLNTQPIPIVSMTNVTWPYLLLMFCVNNYLNIMIMKIQFYTFDS